jgi:Protein of unknown function (DUF3037)
MIGYQYTLIKYIHNDASGECVNVGLALLAPEHRMLKVQFNPRCGRISRFFRNAFDRNHYRTVTRALTEQFNHLAETLRERPDDPAPLERVPGGLDRLMETVLPEDSTAIRWGPVFGGVTHDVNSRFDALFAEFVTRHERPAAHRRHPETQVHDAGKVQVLRKE